MPIEYRDALIWPGAVAQDGAFALPTSLPGHESAKVLIETIFGKGYPLVLSTTAMQAVISDSSTSTYRSVYRCNHQVVEVSVVDDAGQAVNCFGSELTWVVVDAADRVILTKSTDDGIAYTDAAAGLAELTLTAEDTDLPSGEYRHELLLTDIDGHRYTVLTGVLSIRTSLTIGV